MQLAAAADQASPPDMAGKKMSMPIRPFHIDKGGHSAAWEQSELFTAEMRAAFRPLRKSLNG